MTWTTTVPVVTSTAISSTDYNEQALDNLDHLYDNLPTRATLWHNEATVTNGNAIATTIDASQVHNVYFAQTAAADADEFTQTLVLAAGTYTMYVLGKTGTSGGKIDWDLSGTAIATAQDWYANPGVNNTIKTVAAIVISEGGRKVLTGTVNGKNVASGGYIINLTQIWFKQATDA